MQINAKHKSINLASDINNQGNMQFRFVEGSMSADIYPACIRARLVRAGEASNACTQTLRRGNGDGMYAQGKPLQHGKP